MTWPDSGSPPASAEQSHRTKGLLRLTMACNERCPFCNVPVEDYPRPTPPDEQIAAELDAFVASGEQTLTISGGEPTVLRKRLLAVVAEARQRGVPYVELQTNAVLIDETYARELAEAGLTSAFVSFLSHVPAHHDVLAGLEGAFERCLRGMDALLAEGVRVTLNPVIALATQELVPDYIDFVAARLPGVRSISLSAVQPHGRGAQNLELLPDYAVLAAVVPEARRRAQAHGIELLNPYCGLPACIGWDDALDRSVEAIEAELGGWQATPGVENVGDKRQDAPCRACALRTRCGGAWHAYWDVRGGSGIGAPIALVPPWEGEQLGPIVWAHARGFADGEAERLLASGCTDVALELDPDALQDRTTLRELRRLVRAAQGVPDQHQVRVHIGLRPGGTQETWKAIQLAVATGAHSVQVIDPDPRWHELVEAASR